MQKSILEVGGRCVLKASLIGWILSHIQLHFGCCCMMEVLPSELLQLLDSWTTLIVDIRAEYSMVDRGDIFLGKYNDIVPENLVQELGGLSTLNSFRDLVILGSCPVETEKFALDLVTITPGPRIWFSTFQIVKQHYPSLLKIQSDISSDNEEFNERQQCLNSVIALRKHLSSWLSSKRRSVNHPAAPNCILKDHIYLGSEDSTHDDFLKLFNIRHVVQLNQVQHANNEQNVTYHQHVIPDNADACDSLISSIFPQTLKLVHEAIARNERVLIHCQAGMSRSATLVLLLLMELNKWSLEQAWIHVLKQRPIIAPNEAFCKLLQVYAGNALPSFWMMQPNLALNRMKIQMTALYYKDK